MTYRIATNQISDIFYDTYLKRCHSQSYKTNRMPLTWPFVSGSYNIVQLNNVLVGGLDFYCDRTVQFDESPKAHTYFVSLGIAGDISYETGAKDPCIEFNPGYAYLGFASAHSTLISRLKSNTQLRFLTLFIEKPLLLEYVAEFGNQELLKKIKTAYKSQLFRQIKLNQRHQMIATEFFNCPFQGAMKQLYMDNIASELMYSLLGSLCKDKTIPFNLSGRDKERLYEAKRILTADLSNPPTISELAKQTAMNEDKLKKGFQLLFNNTVFKTLTESRMQHAITQLERSDMSVAEIANDAGYNNVSAFIKTFRKAYGTTPNSLRKSKAYYM